jgi:biopolymer transport protein TolR
MGISVGDSKRGIVREINVVPLIDILLVLLVIFMVIPNSRGMKAEIPQPSTDPSDTKPAPGIVVVQVLADGSLKLNQTPVAWEMLRDKLQEIFKSRADRVAFVRGENLVEFQAVAKVIDDMHAAGISSVGLLTPQLELGH